MNDTLYLALFFICQLVLWFTWEVTIRKKVLFAQLLQFYERATTEGTREYEIVYASYSLMAEHSKVTIGKHVKNVLNGWMGREVRDTEDVLDDIDNEIESNGVQRTIDGAQILLAKTSKKSKVASSILELIEVAKMAGMSGQEGGNSGNSGRIR